MKRFTEINEELKFSYDELVKDYENCDYVSGQEKKNLIAKYNVQTKKIKDIQLAILEHIRNERNSRTTYTKDDILWFNRLSDYPSRYDKIKEFYDKENIKFIEFLKASFETELKERQMGGGRTLFDYRHAANSRAYSISSNDRYKITKYLNVIKYLEEENPMAIASKASHDNIINAIIVKLNDQMKDFKADFLERIKQNAIDTYRNAPKIIDDITKKVQELEQQRDERRAEIKSKGGRAYGDYIYDGISKRIEKALTQRRQLKVILRDSEQAYVDNELEQGEQYFNKNVMALAERISSKGFDITNLMVSNITEDPKIFQMMLTDNKKTMYARSIIAAQWSDKVTAHYRFIITNRPTTKLPDEYTEETE